MATRARRGRIFVLSPANCGGARARLVMSPTAVFPLADRLRSSEGAPIGEVFSFLSGLYFRGKLAYARYFARSPDPAGSLTSSGVLVITPNAGLRGADTPVTVDALRAFAEVEVSASNERYRRPLEATASRLADAIGPACDVVFLGSIATAKYVDVLGAIFGHRLLFPTDFVGRGDMSRGGLLLRRVADGRELEYAPIVGALRHGQRPPKLTPLRR